MNSFFTAIIIKSKSFAKVFWRLSPMVRIIVLLTLVGGAFAFGQFGGDDAGAPFVQKSNRSVTIASVALLSEDVSTLPLLGIVSSKSEAAIKAESGGKLVEVYKRLGDYVSAGTIIAEFENSAERAQVLQAEGAFEAAKAGKSIAGIQEGGANLSLAEARINAVNSLSSAYTVLDDAIRTKTDTMWRNPQTRNPEFAVTIADSRLVIELVEERSAIELLLKNRDEQNKNLNSATDLVLELNKAETEAKYIKDYLDDLSLALSRAIADGNASAIQIEGYKASTGIARNAASGILGSLAASRNALNGSIITQDLAQKNAAQNSAESTSEAGLKAALGNLRAAESRLEKTIVRSPISGTLNSLSIETGDYIAPFTDIAVLANNGALEVLAYVTEDDREEISVGGKVLIEKNISGIITRIAPALDPKTKKIEVRIGLPLGSENLINGQSVSIEVIRTKKTKGVANIRPTRIPLAALKLTPDGAIVFSVSPEHTLIAHQVKEGALQGENITIIFGLTADMEIVTDARGLKEGMKVSITN